MPWILLAGSALASAAPVSWDGGGDGVSWHDARNWSGDALPGAADDVSITAPGAEVVFSTGAAMVRSLNCPRTLRLTGGTLTVTGDAFFGGGALRLVGGEFDGTALLRGGTLELAGSETSAATFILQSACDLHGNIAAAHTVWVQGSNPGNHGVTTWRTGWRNAGTLRLESVHSTWASRLFLPADAPADAFLVNEPVATLHAGHGAGGLRELGARLDNRGTVSINGGASLSQTFGGGPTLRLREGGRIEADAASEFVLREGELHLDGGGLAGRVVALNSRLRLERSAAGSGPLVAAGTCRLEAHTAGAELWVQGSNPFQHAMLEALPDAPIAGPVRFESIHSTWASQFRAPDGARLLPGGVLRAVRGAGGVRDFFGTLSNAGHIVVAEDTGTLFRGRYIGAGGGVSGPFFIFNSTIEFAASPAMPPDRLTVVGHDNLLLSGIPAGQTLLLQGRNGQGHAGLRIANDTAVAGTLELGTVESTWTSAVTLAEGATLTLTAGGALRVGRGAGGNRIVSGRVVNHGAVTVEDGIWLRLDGQPAAFVQAGGGITVGEGGRFEQFGGRFDWQAGPLSGEVMAINAAVNVAATVASPSTLILAGTDSVLEGNLAPPATLWVRGENRHGHGRLRVPGTAVNRGTLRLESINSTWASTLATAEGASLVNEGLIEVRPGSGGAREFSGDLVHRGRIEVADGTHLVLLGSVEATGGRTLGSHELLNVRLRVTAEPAEPAFYRLTGHACELLTDNLPRTALRLEGNNARGHAALRVPANFVNRGTLELAAVNSTWSSTLLAPEAGRVLNAPGGRLVVSVGAGGARTITGPLRNEGELEVWIPAAIQGELVNAAGGTVRGRGVLDLGGRTFHNHGALLVGEPYGILRIVGHFTQSAAGRLELGLGGSPEQGGLQDQLRVDGTARLGGRLDVVAPAGFSPAENDEFLLLQAGMRLGQFNPLNRPAAPAGLVFSPRYDATTLRLTVVAGDPALEPPLITRQPVGRFMLDGEEVTLEVAAIGSSPLAYQWLRDGSPLTGASGPTLRVAAGPATHGTYAVEVSNPAGRVLSDPARLLRLEARIPVEIAVRPTLPPVPGDGAVIELFNGLGGGHAPAPADLEGLAPSGVTRAPFLDFPRPGLVVGVGGRFDLFFADTTVPPESVRGLEARNFILRTRPYLAVSRAFDLDPATPEIELELGVGSDDGFELRVGDTVLGRAGDRGFTYSWMAVAFAAEGLYPLQLLYAANDAGHSGLELSWKTALAPGGEIIPQTVLYTTPDLGDRLITFEELPAGTVVADQYAGLGVRFETTGGVQVTAARPQRFVPVSPPRVLGDPAESGTAPGAVTLRFTGPEGRGQGVTDFVSFFVIDAEAPGAVVRAFDPDGAEIHRSEHRAGAGTQERVVIRRAQPDIARVTVMLGGGGEDTAAVDNLSFTAPRPFNRPPTIAGPAEAALDEGQTLQAEFLADDPDADDTLTFALVPPVPAGVGLDPRTGRLTWPTTEAHGPGTYALRVRVLDSGEPPLSADHLLTVTVREVNQPPVFPPVGDRLVYAGDTFTLQLVAFDADLPPQALNFSLLAGPPGLTVTPQGRLTWTTPAVNGQFPVRVRVADSFDPPGTAEAAFNVRVLAAPDLVITRLEAPSEGETGAPFNVTYRETNLGNAPATGSWVQRLWLSADDRLDAGDTLLGEHPFSGTVGPGQFIERTVQFRFPSAAGRYWIIAEADALNAVVERAEDNNLRVLAAPVVVGAAYTATVGTDFEVGLAGTPIVMSGSAVRRGGAPAAFELVNVHLKVRGTRRILAALTDEQGRFALTFRPLPGEAGDYTIGAAHPGEPDAPVQDSFRLLGMEFVPAEAGFDLRALSSAVRRVTLRNRSEAPLSGLTVVTENLPSTLRLNVAAPARLAGGEEAPVELELTSTADESISGTVTVRLLSAEGALATLRLHVATRSLAPVLVVEPGRLEAAMVRGDQTVVDFTVRNAGGRPTGPLNVLLPVLPWLASATSGPLPPLAPGETATLSLLLTPPSDLPLALYPGNLVVTDGEASANVPFRFACVSSALASLEVETVDEFTYYAEGAPRVAGARVEVRDRLTGAVAAQGATGADGRVRFDNLREGIYEVVASAPDHNDSRQTILLTAGRLNEHLAFLVRQLVKYHFTVEEVEIEERTRIAVETVFETVVPAPVITVEPAFIDLNEITQDRVEIELRITNHGLVAAQAARLQFGSSPRFRFTPLQEDLGDLPARSSVTVPLVIERLAGAPRPGGAGPRMLSLTTHSGGGDCPTARLLYELICGPLTNRYSVPIGLGGTGCGGGGGDWVFGGGGGGEAASAGAIFFGPSVPCDPCAAEILKILAECIFDLLPIPDPIPCIKGTAGCIKDPGWLGCAGAAVNCLSAAGKKIPFLGQFLTTLDCLDKFDKACKETKPKSPDGSPAGRRQLQSRLHRTDPTTFPGLNRVLEQARRLRAVVEVFRVLLGDDAWLHGGQTEAFNEFLAAFAEAIAPNGDAGEYVSAAERAALLSGPLPVGGDDRTASRFLDRWNRSLDYEARGIRDLADVPPGESTDFLARDQFRAAVEAAAAAIELNEAEGFVDFFAAIKAAVDRLKANIAQAAAGGGVCARVRLRLDQEAVQTRQGFKATLELVNDSGDPLEGVQVALDLRDDAGAPAAARFGVPAPELTHLGDIAGGGTLAARTTGRVVWTIIPGHEAAPSPEPARYWVGGEFSYVQQGVRVRVPLTPVAIYVHPTPRLTVAYFHERDVRADDPFTPEVEPSIPYSLAVLVKNRGFGPARNLRIASSQPRIIENEKGLLISFELLATQVGTEPLSPSLTVSLGDVPPGGTRQGRWLFRSSLQGQFIEYSATFEHLGLFSQFPELASIESVEIHELIRIVRAIGAAEDGLPDFLVNDVPDDDFLPDTLHLSQGGTAPVAVVRGASFDGAPTTADLEVGFTAAAPAGWVYFRLPDPGAGRFRMTRMLRADGSEVPSDNAWSTDRTFVAGGRRPVYEHTLHLFDRVPAAGPVTYRVQYAPPPPADDVAPGSQVAPLPPGSRPAFPVQWSGEDNAGGSGLASFDIFVSVDGGAFAPWLQGVTTRGAVFNGEPGRSYAFYSVAVDHAGNREAPPAVPDAVTTVGGANTAPVLDPVAPLTVAEGALVTFVLQASDPDGDALAFTLGPEAPPGAVVHPRTGVFTWQTGEAHGPGAYRFTVAVTDNGVPPLSSRVPVEIVVQEVNQPPVISPLRDVILNEGSPLAVQVVAQDEDLPLQPLAFRLLPPVPPGMAISQTGLITWTPDEFQGPAWHRVTVGVSDGVAETAASFRVFVRDVRPDFTLRAGASRVFAGRAGSLPLSLAASLDVAASFRLRLQGDETAAGISGLRLVPGAGRFAALSLTPAGDLAFDVAMTLAPGAAQEGPQEARFEFDAQADTPSGIVRFELRDVVAEAGGRLLSRPAVRDGRLVVINREPVLEWLREGGLRLRLHGRPAGRYTIEYRQSWDADDAWQPLEEITLDAAGLLDRPWHLPEGVSTLFLRGRE